MYTSIMELFNDYLFQLSEDADAPRAHVLEEQLNEEGFFVDIPDGMSVPDSDPKFDTWIAANIYLVDAMRNDFIIAKTTNRSIREKKRVGKQTTPDANNSSHAQTSQQHNHGIDFDKELNQLWAEYKSRDLNA